jgi:peptidoglycan/LPS O-acetylase OafA/YrhL
MTVQQPHLSHPKYRPDIDGLRAIAVLSVVAFHAFPSWVRGGFIGVDVFFVISGYLISTIIFENLDKGTFSFFDFYSRRIRRIFPALLIVLIACFAFGWFTLLANEYKQLGKHIAAGAGFLSNFILWNEAGYFDNSADTKPLLHLWSLGIEEQFYIVWPLLLWFAWKRKFNLLTITIVVAIASFVLNIKGVKQDMVATFYSPQTRFWELLSGSLCAWFTLHKKDALTGMKSNIDVWLSRVVYSEKQASDGKTLANILSFIGLLLLLYGFWRINKELSFPGKWALLPVLGTLLIITAGSKAWINRIILSNKVAVWFGLISFPLYLWHWPILSFARIVEGEVPSRNIRIAAVVLSIVLAWLTYRLVERPLRFGNHSKAKVAVLVMLMTVIGYVGYNTYERNGLSFRFAIQARNLAESIDFQWHSYIQFEKCHLQTSSKLIHDDTCFQTARPIVVLWGDSHAASLYPGLKNLQGGDKFGLTQLTQSACPPIFGLKVLRERANCNEINNNVFLSLIKMQPNILILHAAWRHDHYPLSNEDLYVKVKETVDKIKIKLPNTELIIVGPVPRWGGSPQKEAFKYWKHSIDKTAMLPKYLDTIIPTDFEDILIRISSESNIKYLSPIDYLCIDSKCLWKVGDGELDFVAVDDGHLSRAASIFLANKLFDNLFEK